MNTGCSIGRDHTVADLTWDEVEKALESLRLHYEFEAKQPHQPLYGDGYEDWLQPAAESAAALTKALHCVVAVRWMEEQNVGVERVLYKGCLGWEPAPHPETSDYHDTLVRLCNLRTEVGWPTPLEAIEAAMAAVKGESGDDG